MNKQRKTGSGSGPLGWWLGLAVALLFGVLAGCGGSSTASSGSSGSGDVTVSMTDAPGDFLAYSVDVTALQFVKADGTTVSALPLTTRIDFTQYTDLSELFTVATVPSGVYTQVVMTLDYSNADVEVQDSAGNAQKATLVDDSGNPVTTLNVTLALPSTQPLTIKPGVPASLALDFDLSASNQVLSESPAKVQVEPFLLADLSLDTTREHRARGLLQQVNSSAQTFQMQLRPFAIRQASWGKVTVSTNSNTLYEINGVHYSGSTGLQQLATLAANTAVIAEGTVSGTQQLSASEVLAGSSVPWSDKDVVEGTVIKRVGNELTVRGHYINRTDGIAVFNSDILVDVDGSTVVTRLEGDQSGLDSSVISVGQKVTAFGALSQSGSQYTLDSTGSGNRVHLNVTQMEANYTSQSGNLMTANVDYIEARLPSIFDFSGTGASSATDSNPAQYHVNVAGLSLSGIGSGDILRVRGYVEPFGTVTTTDFDAVSLIDLNQDNLAAGLVVRWSGGSASPFASIGSDSMVVNLSGSSDSLRLAGVSVDISGQAQLTLSARTAGVGRFAIKVKGQHGITFYRNFSDFSAALQSQLSSGNTLLQLVSHGRYDSGSQTLTTAAALALVQ